MIAQRARERRKRRREERKEPLEGLGDSILVASPIGMKTAWDSSGASSFERETRSLPVSFHFLHLYIYVSHFYTSTCLCVYLSINLFSPSVHLPLTLCFLNGHPIPMLQELKQAESSLRRMIAVGFKGNAARFKKAMSNHDGDADGRVTHDEFIRVLMKLGTSLKPGEHEILMRTFDPEGRGTIDYHKATDLIYMTDGTYKEKLKARSVKKVLDKIQYKYGLDNLSTMFASLDDNKDGSVSYKELRRGLSNLGLELSDSEFTGVVEGESSMNRSSTAFIFIEMNSPRSQLCQSC